MSTVARLASFALALALLFGGAVAVGGAVGPQRDSPTATPAEHGAMTAQPVRGLAVSTDGLTLELARTTAPQGQRFDLPFRIVDRDGRTVRAFDVEHTKRMHFIVARRDLTGFEHLHPTQAKDGTWSIPVTLPDAGVYRVFADFSVGSKARTLADDLTVDGTLRARPLPAPSGSVEVDGLRVALTEGATRAGTESGLSFAVTREGRPVAVQDYLGAKGHLVALRQGDLAFLHVHPDERSLRFMSTFPTVGSYRLFLQFRTDGRVHTAAFTQEVSR